jgi:hypothetical protein
MAEDIIIEKKQLGIEGRGPRAITSINIFLVAIIKVWYTFFYQTHAFKELPAFWVPISLGEPTFKEVSCQTNCMSAVSPIR